MSSRHRIDHHRCYVLLVVLAVLTAGCADPDLPPRDNPLDPGGTKWYNPGITMLSGPAAGEAIHVTSVTFRWQGTGGANSYRWQLDGSVWHAWTTQDWARFDFLDEGQHQFSLIAKADYGPISLPTQSVFTVDSVPTPALLAVPWHQTADSGGPILISLVTKGAVPITKARFRLRYDSLALQFDQFYLPVVGWSSPVTSDSSSPGLINVTVQQTPATVGMTNAVLAHMRFILRAGRHDDSIAFAAGSTLWDVAGAPISLSAMRGSHFSVSP